MCLMELSPQFRMMFLLPYSWPVMTTAISWVVGWLNFPLCSPDGLLLTLITTWKCGAFQLICETLDVAAVSMDHVLKTQNGVILYVIEVWSAVLCLPVLVSHKVNLETLWILIQHWKQQSDVMIDLPLNLGMIPPSLIMLAPNDVICQV